jgi:hypothetical protein
MKKSILITGLIFFVVLFFQTCKKDNLRNLDCSNIPATYNSDIKPIISSHCSTSNSCHGTGSTLDYSDYAKLKAVADNGSLEKTTIKDKSMPPSGALTLDDRKKIKCWLNNGSPNN